MDARTAANTAIDRLRTKSERNSRICETLEDHTAELEDCHQARMNTDFVGFKKLTHLLPSKQ
jgi:DNA-directed RNA polymerase specialized sigma24 family protein